MEAEREMLQQERLSQLNSWLGSKWEPPNLEFLEFKSWKPSARNAETILFKKAAV